MKNEVARLCPTERRLLLRGLLLALKAFITREALSHAGGVEAVGPPRDKPAPLQRKGRLK